MVSSLPSSPGVYWFLDENEVVLYVGKATSLRSRVGSYTRIKNHHPRTFNLVTTATKLKYKELSSELEASLVEAQLIKTYQPHYNVDLKDDKSPLYIIVTKDDFPRVLTARKKQLATVYKDLPKHNIYGPFSSGYSARQIIKIGRRIFKFCNLNPSLKKSGKPCFYTHIHLCSGACKGQISVEDYQQMIRSLKLFLSGRKKTLLKNLKKEMEQSSADKAYEKAAKIRDQIQAITYYYDQRRGLNFDPDLPVLEDDKSSYLSNRLAQLLHMAGLVPQAYPVNRIEAYDISNTSGQLSTASMVVFENGKPATSEYRKFRIKTVEGPNDTAMLKEAITRRLQHPEWPYPDLIVIDGGKGQLRSVLSVVGNSIPTVSIVKRPDRLLIPQELKGELSYFELKLEEGKPISNLIQSLRDEAHRFAKQYHSKLRRTHGMLK